MAYTWQEYQTNCAELKAAGCSFSAESIAATLAILSPADRTLKAKSWARWLKTYANRHEVLKELAKFPVDFRKEVGHLLANS